MQHDYLIPKLFGICLLFVACYMSVWFLVAKKRKRLDIVDRVWGGGFVLMAWLAVIAQPSVRTYMVAVMVSVWAVRLTSHLSRRGRLHAEDPRYAELAKKWNTRNIWPRAYRSVFLLQGFLIVIIGMPIIFNVGTALPELRLLFTAGYIVWALGFYIEYRADAQLAEFKSDAANKGKVLDAGLWQYSRHPNYFGELLQWWGIGLIASQTSFGWAALVGPALLTVLIKYVSGIPTVEKHRENDLQYQEYKKHTNPLLPWPTKH